MTNRHIAASALLLSQSVVRPALAALYEDPADLPTNKSYDYIVIGGECRIMCRYATARIVIEKPFQPEPEVHPSLLGFRKIRV